MLHSTITPQFHCMFEQSGTFKNVFKKLGYKAKDYDIANDYNETDVQCDLFSEIEKGYLGLKSIFDKVKPTDYILAFFPCTQFECQKNMFFRGNAFQMKNFTDEEKLASNLFYHKQLHEYYELITKLAILCLRKNLKLVIENPYNQPHYLTSYWSLKPSIVDTNRRLHGDYYKKPTQYWFINCEPKSNVVNMEFQEVEKRIVSPNEWSSKPLVRERSEIHPQYAEWFIRSYLIEQEEFNLS